MSAALWLLIVWTVVVPAVVLVAALRIASSRARASAPVPYRRPGRPDRARSSLEF